jgi:hypothetical protein
VNGPHETNLERGSTEGRAASHGGEGNSGLIKDREDQAALGGMCEGGTSTKDDLETWEIRNLSTADEAVEYAQRNEPIGAESGRGAEVGGPHTSDDDGER